MSQYDDVIIGAGHNGLVCATYLAKKGRRVLLLEASHTVGGLASKHEFYSGFCVTVAQTLTHFSDKVAKDLELSKHGCEFVEAPLTDTALAVDGQHISITSNGLSGVSSDDELHLRQYRKLMATFARVLSPFWLKTIPRIGAGGVKENLIFAYLGVKLRLLGKRDMGEFMRVATLPTRDLMDEFFDSEQLKALLSWDALVGSRMAPRSPNGSVMALLYKMSGRFGGNHYLPKSGAVSALVSALSNAACSAGVEIRTNAAVENISLICDHQGQRTSGVTLSSGEQISANNVVSAIDPKQTFMKLVGAENLEVEFTHRISRLRTDGLVAKMHLALDELPEFPGVKDLGGRMIIAPTQDTIEFAYDNAKYGESPTQPVLEIFIPSLHDSSLAPAGKHVLSANIMYVPYAHKDGWNNNNKGDLYQRVIEILSHYAPNIEQHVIHGELLTPADLERKFNVTGGHWHHGELSMWQMLMMRPTYEAAQYSTPIPGLYLCSAGCHPGGGLSGAAGHNAANEILKAAKS